MEIERNCQGKSSTVSVDVFKEELRRIILTKGKETDFQPLIAKKAMKGYRNNSFATSDSTIIASDLESLEKINEFLKRDEGSKKELRQAHQDIEQNEARIKQLEEVNEAIEKIVERVMDESLYVFANGDNKDIYRSVLRSFDPNRRYPCGLSGSVEERIQHCREHGGISQRGSFDLVTRTAGFEEIYRSKNSGLLWSDIIYRFNREGSKSCSENRAEFGGIKTSWRLPTIFEFKQEYKNGIQKLPYMSYADAVELNAYRHYYYFITSTELTDDHRAEVGEYETGLETPFSPSSGGAWFFTIDPRNGKVMATQGYPSNGNLFALHARCVAE